MTSLAEIALEHARQLLADQAPKTPTFAVPKINMPASTPVSTGFVAPAPADRYMFLQGRRWAVDLVESLRSDPATKVIERLAGATAGRPVSYVAGVQSVINALQEAGQPAGKPDLTTETGRRKTRWTPAEDQLVQQFYAEKSNAFMTGVLPGRTIEAICQRAMGMGIRKTPEHRSAASRRSFLAQCEARGVQPGQQPRPVGSTHRKGRYILIKVAQPDVWKPLHTHIWEQANGPVPEGMIVAAKDGNVRNAVLENLCLRTFAENQLRRNKNYRHLPEEVVDILHLQNEIKKTIKRKRSNEK